MKILIIRFSSFGDVVLTTPVIKAIKEKYKNAKIDFLVYNTFSEAITLNPNLQNIIKFDKKKSKDKKYIKELVDKLKLENYDYVIDLHSKLLSRIVGRGIANFTKTKYIKYNKRKWWKTLLVKAKLITYNADCTIVESYFSSLKKLDIHYKKYYKDILENGYGDNLEFYINSENENEILSKYNLKNNDYVVLAPGASKFTKKWPYYDELAHLISQKMNLKVFVIGGSEDEQSVNEDKDGKIVNLCGELSFKESGIFLKYCKFSVVNDSGPFHISRALKTKTYVFFGPTDPKLFAFENKTHLFYNENCKPHSLYGDDKFQNKYKECMTGISVDEVLEVIQKDFN